MKTWIKVWLVLLMGAVVVVYVVSLLHICTKATRAAMAMTQVEDLLFAGMDECRQLGKCMDRADADGLVQAYKDAHDDVTLYGSKCLGDK